MVAAGPEGDVGEEGCKDFLVTECEMGLGEGRSELQGFWPVRLEGWHCIN